MAYNPDIHHRRSIRLRGFDYSQPAAYFITVCTWQREHRFGEVVNGEMVLNDAGDIVVEEWLQTAVKRPSITLGAFVVMPNHFHAIVGIGTNTAGATCGHPLECGTNTVGARFIAPGPIAPIPDQGTINPGAINRAPTVGDIVRQFKARSTHAINTLHNTRGRPVWQRNYWERIIRTRDEGNALGQYIDNNPARWEHDTLYSESHELQRRHRPHRHLAPLPQGDV